jgi:hypothetical protein
MAIMKVAIYVLNCMHPCTQSVFHATIKKFTPWILQVKERKKERKCSYQQYQKLQLLFTGNISNHMAILSTTLSLQIIITTLHKNIKTAYQSLIKQHTKSWKMF